MTIMKPVDSVWQTDSKKFYLTSKKTWQNAENSNTTG